MKLLLFFLLSFSSCFAGNFENYFPRLIKSEGVIFTVTQYDRGGATKYGITLATFKMWCNSRFIIISNCDKDGNGMVNTNDLRITTILDVKPIYKRVYWDLIKADFIENQAIAEIICDMAINCGTGYRSQHIKAIQHFLSLKNDGKIGGNTLAAINKTNPLKLYNYIYQYRANFYRRLGKGNQKRFERGWLNRIKNLRELQHIAGFI